MDGSLLPIVGTSALLAVLYLSSRSSRHPPYPPGPPRRPVIGNLFDVPTEREAETFSEWAREHGDIIHLDALGMHIVVLGTVDLERECFERRGQKYAGRFVPEMAGLIGLREWVIGLMKPTARWRTARKNLVAHFAPVALPTYGPRFQRECAVLLKHLLDTPEDFFAHSARFASALLISAIYGYSVKADGRDWMLELHDDALNENSKAMTSAWTVNLIPALRFLPAWTPFVGFHREAARLRPLAVMVLHEPTDAMKQNPNAYKESLVSRMFARGDADELLIKSAALTAFNAGRDGLRSVVLSFILAMALHPEAQKRAQDEIDSVLGGLRLPEMDDHVRLPYTARLAEEVSRWMPHGPIGLPHISLEDDELNGYWIPKGSLVISNMLYQAHDDRVYSNPLDFDPDRYLPPRSEPSMSPFGHGRRSCVGRHLAEHSGFLVIACILATFDITVAPGKPPPVKAYAPGLIAEPSKFECSIRAREGSASLVKEAAEKAMEG